ncbi:hypothetical protein KN1_12800 [Stygiolobus caldivivus]|uniref:Glycosyltransferase 2-like domain-containing protein n=2 Tax=Stygiolobus caldivivus TaxID=2824673 RepID=A0A8D5U6P2_9CREN|nr:hypothetical protein KN1_12800 [Stygiolobus caldivivus]
MAYTGFVIPVHNTRQGVLERTVKGLYGQTSLPIYIVDDGSKRTETVEYLRKLESHKQIEVIHLEGNKGKIEALATGVREGDITYPFFIDDDVTIKVNPLIGDEWGSLDTIIEKREINLLSDGSCIVYPVGARNRGENVLTKLQDLEHIVSTYYVRRLLNHGLFINGTGSLWRSKDFLEIYDLHSKVHEGDDLETSLISYGLGKEVVFSDGLFLLAEMEKGFKGWFRQRLKWEYGKWRLLKRYWKEVLKNPNNFSYYFASEFLLLSFISDKLGFLFSLLLLSSIFSKRSYSWPKTNRVKEAMIYVPFIGLLAYINPLILAVTPVYYYSLLKLMKKKYDIYDDRTIKDVLGLFAYSTFYLSVLQPAGLVYSVYRAVTAKPTLPR